jgi:hypothetical protein
MQAEAASGLKTMALVDEAVANEVLATEDGVVLKKRLLNDVQKLIGLGVSLPSSQEVETVDQRRLLIDKRNTKLLGREKARLPMKPHRMRKTANEVRSEEGGQFRPLLSPIPSTRSRSL